MDMSQIIVPKSDQINADDLITGPRTIKIKAVKVTPGTEQPVSIQIEGDTKVYRPCKSMCRVMVAAWGPDSRTYAGRSMTLYRDPKVKWGGLEVGGIRISAMSHIDTPMTIALTETRASRKPFTVKPLATEPEPVAAPKGRQTAEEWVSAYQAQLASCDSLAALESVQQRAASALAKLQATRPDLHRVAVETGIRRASELAATDDDPFAADVEDA